MGARNRMSDIRNERKPGQFLHRKKEDTDRNGDRDAGRRQMAS